ncbi:MAG: hypothetical protein K2K05_09315, partial [Muribaculaceae bacterium]|nr:hypothetical protein [Muribaculaceae bacterium]
ALFCTNKENFNIENGDIATELNSSNMLWCLSGNIALTHKILFGIDFEKDGLAFRPFVPKALAATRSLDNFKYRGASLDITVSGYGSEIRSFKVNGKEQQPFIPADKAKGKMKVEIVMADNEIPQIGINRASQANAPITPVAWLEGTTLTWNPIEYIGGYIVLKDGEEVARTHATTYDASDPGEYQVIGVADDGTPSFASEPRSTRRQNYYPLGNVSNDKTSVLDIPITIDEPGDYFITFNYANGNGPVNTENKCAIRTLSVDGSRSGLVVMPQRGRDNWDEYGWSNSVKVNLAPGTHTLTLDFRPEDENMNIDTNHAVVSGVRLVKQ